MECGVAPEDHVVWFYDARARLVDRIVAFTAEGLQNGERVLLAAGADVLAGVYRHLTDAGVDQSLLVTADATDMLRHFYTGDTIDRDKFDASVGELVRSHADRPLRVFGEMVAQLWADGAVQAAIQLESLWGELRVHTPFQLVCAYPSAIVTDERMHGPVNTVCGLHSEVTLGDDGYASALRAYPPSADAVREVRRFVRACVASNAGDDASIEDVLLIASELASNAVRHAGSPFVVEIALAPDSLRLGVRDASHDPPRLVPLTGLSETGRGIATVAALSERWGTETHAVGKTVWAELPLGR